VPSCVVVAKPFWMWTAVESTESSITKTEESSESISIFDELDEPRQLRRSFVKMVKSLGPNKDPCGTPEGIFIFVELRPLIETLVSVTEII